MDITKLKDLPKDELDTLLNGENIGIEETSYMKPLTTQELIDKKDQFALAAIDKETIEGELKDIKDEFKSRLKPVQQVLDAARLAIRQRGEWTKGKCYKLPDYDNKMVHIVDVDGNVISSRIMKPEERQFTISQKAI
jgi:hypothetical protein